MPPIGRRFWLALDMDRNAARHGGRKVGYDRGILHSLHVEQVGEKRTNELDLPGRVVVSRLIQVHSSRQQMIVPEAQRLVIQHIDSADEKPASDQKDEREGDFA